MLYIVKELPEHVKLAPFLQGADRYAVVSSFGVSYYIPLLPKIRALLELDREGNDSRRDRRLRWSKFEKADALRQIVQCLEAQVRDVELAGIEQNVTERLLDEMRGAVARKVRTVARKQAQLQLTNGTKE